MNVKEADEMADPCGTSVFCGVIATVDSAPVVLKITTDPGVVAAGIFVASPDTVADAVVTIFTTIVPVDVGAFVVVVVVVGG